MKTIFQKSLLPVLRLPYDVALNLLIIGAFAPRLRRCGTATVRMLAVLLWFNFCNTSLAIAQKARTVSGVGITVEDLDREVVFFTQVLDFKKIKDETISGENVAGLYGLSGRTASVHIVTLRLGEEEIHLLDFDDQHPGRPSPPDTQGNDRWFQHLAIVVSDMDSAYQKLLEHKVLHVSTAPQTLPDYLPNAAGIRAFYFRDPEGHNLELIWFPPGKGHPKWQEASAKGQEGKGKGQNSAPSSFFLGIDHTAISIADTDSSLTFYRDRLGLAVGGHSENYGPEQEHLNQVFGARLDINGLHADSGIGLEFLRYIAPPGGRPFPAGSQSVDLWHYQTELLVDDLSGILQHFEQQGFTQISSAVVPSEDRKQLLLRDPDGHAVLLTEMTGLKTDRR